MTVPAKLTHGTVLSESQVAPEIEAPNEHADSREAALKKLTRISSILTVIVAGLALFSDGYNAQIIGYMKPLFSELYQDHAYSSTISTRLTNSYLIGEIFGMLFFGYTIDRIGRRTGIVFATLFLILGVVLASESSSFSPTNSVSLVRTQERVVNGFQSKLSTCLAAAHGTSELGMFWMMIVGRGVAGFGAGGEYPVCGTGSAEASDEGPAVRRRRGILVAMTTDFAIDLGFVIAGVVALIVLATYDERASEGIWRICFGLGFVLPLGLLFFRLRMVDSTQFRRHAIKHGNTVPYSLVLRRYWKPMLGTALSWFMYDFVTYPFGLFSSSIIARLNPESSLVRNIGLGTAVNCFYLPGCILGGLLMDKIGRKQTMALGFACQAVLGFIIGGALDPIQKILPLFIVLYGIFNGLGEMGPGVATFLCGAESFPTPVRGHFLGLAAAVGKAGAAIGTQVFTPIQDSFASTFAGVQAVFLIGAAFSAVGSIIAYTLIPDRERDLEDEDTKFRAYLDDHGFSTKFGESLEKEMRMTTFNL